MSNLASVYVMERADGVLKIGYSVLPERRKWELGGLRLLHTSIEHANARRVENLAHRILGLAGKRIYGRQVREFVERREEESGDKRAVRR